MRAFDVAEFLALCRKFGETPRETGSTLKCGQGDFFARVKMAMERGRRGEVVFCVVRPNGKMVVVRRDAYPPGIFRIPTGGIEEDEDIVDAVYRETEEELGLKAKIARFAGVLKMDLQHGHETLAYQSYLFILRETSGRLLADATDHEINNVKEVDLAGLREVVAALGRIEGGRSDWGRFRQASSGAVLRFLESEVTP